MIALFAVAPSDCVSVLHALITCEAGPRQTSAFCNWTNEVIVQNGIASGNAIRTRAYNVHRETFLIHINTVYITIMCEHIYLFIIVIVNCCFVAVLCAFVVLFGRDVCRTCSCSLFIWPMAHLSRGRPHSLCLPVIVSSACTTVDGAHCVGVLHISIQHLQYILTTQATTSFSFNNKTMSVHRVYRFTSPFKLANWPIYITSYLYKSLNDHAWTTNHVRRSIIFLFVLFVSKSIFNVNFVQWCNITLLLLFCFVMMFVWHCCHTVCCKLHAYFARASKRHCVRCGSSGKNGQKGHFIVNECYNVTGECRLSHDHFTQAQSTRGTKGGNNNWKWSKSQSHVDCLKRCLCRNYFFILSHRTAVRAFYFLLLFRIFFHCVRWPCMHACMYCSTTMSLFMRHKRSRIHIQWSTHLLALHLPPSTGDSISFRFKICLLFISFLTDAGNDDNRCLLRVNGNCRWVSAMPAFVVTIDTGWKSLVDRIDVERCLQCVHWFLRGFFHV